MTRDRHYGLARRGERSFIVVDTGGFEPVAKDGILHEMAKQTRAAIVEADVIVFLVDARTGFAPQDREIAELLRRAGRPVVLAVNKAEGMPPASVVAEFHELGLGTPYPISSAHGENVDLLVEIALGHVPPRAAARTRRTTRTTRIARSASPSSAARTSASRRSSTRCSARSASSRSTSPERRATRSISTSSATGAATR